ncbi:plasmid pRiA4b ORF-3 family protein [Agromyces bracchium]|uniref:plasmid pRiA4b ORF-3 family protein n=1 Tax=Agromyces bracchium TaxID=88376 RepID=UPI0012BA36C1|nr:plasmid pRiA4b ORF-3 family protein [Agromyces bracchium]
MRITLVDSEPEIWRTLDVDGALRLGDLHDAIQLAMGWRDAHLHEFSELEPHPDTRALPQVGRPPRRWMPGDQVADAEDGLAFGGRVEQLIDEHAADVASVFAPTDGPIYYWYDFGDSWWHRIDLIEREHVDAPGASSPPWARRVELVAGAGRCPFEDSGGVHGYAEKLDTLADPASPEHAEIAAWVAGVIWPEPLVLPFEADAFDRDAADRELQLRFEVASDLSGLIRADGDGLVDEASPVVELLEGLPAPFRAALRARLRAEGALAPVQVETDAATRMVRPFTWLLGRIGDSGLALTKAGWMPPTVVHEGMTELGWLDDWIGASNREDITWPIRWLREAARRFGLVRVAKGRLLRTAAGTRLQGDPVGLWRHVAVASVGRQRSDAERMAVTLLAVEIACGRAGTLSEFGDAVANGLDLLGWSQPDGRPLDAYDGIELIRDTWHMLGDLGVFGAVSRFARSGDDAPTTEGRAFARAMLGIR